MIADLTLFLWCAVVNNRVFLVLVVGTAVCGGCQIGSDVATNQGAQSDIALLFPETDWEVFDRRIPAKYGNWTHWDNLDPSTQAAFVADAEDFIKTYRAQWGPEGIPGREREMLELETAALIDDQHPEAPPWAPGFRGFVRRVFFPTTSTLHRKADSLIGRAQLR